MKIILCLVLLVGVHLVGSDKKSENIVKHGNPVDISHLSIPWKNFRLPWSSKPVEIHYYSVHDNKILLEVIHQGDPRFEILQQDQDENEG